MKRELPDTRRFLDSKRTAERSVNLFWVNDRSVDPWDFENTRRREQVSTIGSPALPEGVRRSVVLGIIDMGDDHRCTGYAGKSGLFSGDSRLQALFIPVASGKCRPCPAGQIIRGRNCRSNLKTNHKWTRIGINLLPIFFVALRRSSCVFVDFFFWPLWFTRVCFRQGV